MSPARALLIGWVLAVLAIAAPAAAAERPAVSSAAVRSVALTPQVVAPGARATFSVKGAGTVDFRLSANKRYDASDRRLARRTLKKSKTTLKLAVPRSTALGAYHVLACAPPARKGAKPKCRVSKQRIAVVPKPKPAKVTPQPDTERTASAPIGRDGGSVTATGADGTTYTLTLPEGALLDPTTVTLTPVASIANLPAGASAARAVQVEPAGRRLLKPATLTVGGTQLPSAAALTGFGFDPGGAQFHLAPAALDGQTATVRIFELGGHGIASASQKSRYQFSRTRLPSDLVAQLEQIASVNAPKAKGRLVPAQTGPTDELSATIFSLFIQTQSWALTGQVDDAVLHFVAWDAFANGLVGTYPEILVWRTALATAFSNGIRREIGSALASCLAGDIAQMGRLLRYRDYLYTSLASLPIQTLRGEIDNALETCLQFELDYEVTISGVNSYQEPVSAKVTSTVPLRMTGPGDPSHFIGNAALTVAEYDTGRADCWTHTWNVSPSQDFSVNRMSVDIRRERGTETLPAEIRVRFMLGSLDEQVTHTCDGDPNSTYTDTQHAYDGVVAALLGGAAGGEFELTWTGGGTGGNFSSQSFTRSSESDGNYTGTLTFRLRHTPR